MTVSCGEFAARFKLTHFSICKSIWIPLIASAAEVMPVMRFDRQQLKKLWMDLNDIFRKCWLWAIMRWWKFGDVPDSGEPLIFYPPKNKELISFAHKATHYIM